MAVSLEGCGGFFDAGRDGCEDLFWVLFVPAVGGIFVSIVYVRIYAVGGFGIVDRDRVNFWK